MPSRRAVGFAAGTAVLCASALGGAQPVPPPPPMFGGKDAQLLDITLFTGIGARVGSSAAFDIVSRGAPEIGLGLAYSPSRYWAVAGEYQHTWLGLEMAGPGDLGSVDVTRNLNAAWVSAELHAWRTQAVDLFVTFGPGLLWMSESASAIVIPGIGQSGVPFTCKATDSAHLGLRAGVGAAFSVGGNVWMAPSFLLQNDQLGSEVIDDCANGPGSVTLLTLRLAFTYRAELAKAKR